MSVDKKLSYFVDILTGLSWGDEGKGLAVVNLLKGVIGRTYVACVRYNGGCNAGHTTFIDGVKHVTHTIPTGILVPGVVSFIGRGVKFNFIKVAAEIRDLLEQGIEISRDRLVIDPATHLVLPTHILMDELKEEVSFGKAKIGTTKNGMSQIAVSKMGRRSVRIKDVLDQNGLLQAVMSEHLEMLGMLYPKQISSERFDKINNSYKEVMEAVEFVCQYVSFEEGYSFISRMLRKGDVLAEGAQGFLLDVDHGTYPYVTSSNSGVGAFLDGTGASWKMVRDVFGVAKMWYVTRVGNGPFPTELFPEVDGKYTNDHGLAYLIQNAGEGAEGGEKGATTQRPRRVGYVDLPMLRWAAERAGVTQLILTKGDRPNSNIGTSIDVCREYALNGGAWREYFPADIVTNMTRLQPLYESCEFVPVNPSLLFSDQPAAVKEHVARLASRVGAPVAFISAGHQAGQVVMVGNIPGNGSMLELGTHQSANGHSEI